VIDAIIRSRHPQRPGLYQIQSNGERVWINGPDGASVARISKHGGIDIHRPIAEQADRGECLDCRQDLFGEAAWKHFVRSVLRHFGIYVTARHRPSWASPIGGVVKC
jgi:hypothetical protein